MTAGAGWFPDPEDAAQLRYWDGQVWTDHRAPAVPPAPPAYGQAPPEYPPAYPSSYPTPSTDPGTGLPQFPASPYGYGPPPVGPNPSNTLSIIGIVCGAVALLFCPPLFGTAGLVLGGIARSKHERLANWALGVSAVGLIGGIIIGVALFASDFGGY